MPELSGALAVYMLDKGVSMNSFSDWLGRVYIPGVQPTCGQRLSELLAKIEPDMVDNFFLKRHQRAITKAQARRRELKAKKPKAYIPPLTLAFDSTKHLYVFRTDQASGIRLCQKRSALKTSQSCLGL